MLIRKQRPNGWTFLDALGGGREIGRLTGLPSENLLEQVSYDFPARFIFRSRTLNKKSRFSASSFYSFPPSLSLFLSRLFLRFLCRCFRRIFIGGCRYSAEDTAVPAGIADKRELFNFEASQLSQLQDFPTEWYFIEALFARSKLFILASLSRLRDRRTKLPRPDTQMVSTDSSGSGIMRWPSLCHC